MKVLLIILSILLTCIIILSIVLIKNGKCNLDCGHGKHSSDCTECICDENWIDDQEKKCNKCNLDCGHGTHSSDCTECICDENWIDDQEKKCNKSLCYSGKNGGENKKCENTSPDSCLNTQDPNYMCVKDSVIYKCKGAEDTSNCNGLTQAVCDQTLDSFYACKTIDATCSPPPDLPIDANGACENINDKGQCEEKLITEYSCIWNPKTFSCEYPDGCKNGDCDLSCNDKCDLDKCNDQDYSECCAYTAGKCTTKSKKYNCQYNSKRCDSKIKEGEGNCINEDSDNCETHKDLNYNNEDVNCKFKASGVKCKSKDDLQQNTSCIKEVSDENDCNTPDDFYRCLLPKKNKL